MAFYLACILTDQFVVGQFSLRCFCKLFRFSIVPKKGPKSSLRKPSQPSTIFATMQGDNTTSFYLSESAREGQKLQSNGE